MDYNKFSSFFEVGWGNKLRPFIESKEMTDIYSYLKDRSRKGAKIFPESVYTYEAFKKCKYDDLRVVIMGMCPYHTKKDGIIVADGLALSCSNTKTLASSLESFYKGIEQDLYNGLGLDMVRNPDLTFLAEQGVLLWNAGMTVEENKAGSHNGIWEPFTRFVIEEVLNKYNSGLVFLFLGKDAAKYEKYVAPFIHHTMVVEHPAVSSYSNRPWRHENIFSRTNDILRKSNNIGINWDDFECPI